VGERPDTNQGSLQYFVNYNLANAWYLTSQPIISFNWEAANEDRWLVPFGGGFGKIFAIGAQKLNGNVQAYWNAEMPESTDGPDWTLRFTLVFLFPR
jgi:hypothetical protein